VVLEPSYGLHAARQHNLQMGQVDKEMHLIVSSTLLNKVCMSHTTSSIMMCAGETAASRSQPDERYLLLDLACRRASMGCWENPSMHVPLSKYGTRVRSCLLHLVSTCLFLVRLAI
jgi:hypothetical protein